jgi:hypothetical protein
MGDLTQGDAQDKLQDLSGIVLKPGQNPYDAFIKACNDDHVGLDPIGSALVA